MLYGIRDVLVFIGLYLKMNGENFVTNSRIICTLHLCYGGEQIKDEMGGLCNTHSEYEKIISILTGKPVGKIPLGRI
jgi:hypothetical protein